MISDQKPQNIIFVITMIIGLVSAASLASSAAYYSGSYSIVRYLDIDMTEIRVSNFDPDNITQNPIMNVYFNVEAPPAQTGEAQLTYFTMSLYLNGDKFSYTSFRRNVPLDLRTLYPEYNETFRIGSTILEPEDKQILHDAYDSDEWVFSITLTVFYDIFDSPGDQVRIIAYSYNGMPNGIESSY
ncbi:MAG: hypothetical protein ACXAEF_05970 [Candidatus Thorarchaeota archaeon]|jgi:hypothetical protein